MSYVVGYTYPYTNSGNGLASFYINLVLENVGYRDQKMKAAVNGCLQVGSHYPPPVDIYIRGISGVESCRGFNGCSTRR